MKKIEVYQCELCGAQYKSEEECKECENYHIKPVSVVCAKWLPKGFLKDDPKADGLPLKVSVTFEDGTTLDYKR